MNHSLPNCESRIKSTMKKSISTCALLLAGVGLASGQSFIAGFDFKSTDNSLLQNDLAFELGSEKGAFTLNVKTNADDNYSVSGYTVDGWAAQGDFYSNGVNSFIVGTPTLPPTVLFASGNSASTDAFGNTSAFAQGYSNTRAIAFGVNTNGFFTISVGASSLGGGFDNVSLNFDVAALGSQGQTAGTLGVGGNSVGVTSSFVNQTVNLGNLAAGSLINFDLSGLGNGVTIDNIMIAGTAVPEPSAFAAIAGVLALGFAATRRRQKSA